MEDNPWSHGLSPRVRGNLARSSGTIPPLGSIPACTGEPPLITQGTYPQAVYPRVYGGTLWHLGLCPGVVGLSPRVRGNHLVTFNGGVSGRSIPACTGEPAAKHAETAAVGVYPRVYGGTIMHILLLCH